MDELKFELGKRYRVTFKDGKVIEVLFMGYEPPKFNLIKPDNGFLEGTNWLDGHISIEEVQVSTSKEGGVK